MRWSLDGVYRPETPSSDPARHEQLPDLEEEKFARDLQDRISNLNFHHGRLSPEPAVGTL